MDPDIPSVTRGVGMFLFGMQEVTGALRDLASRQMQRPLTDIGLHRPALAFGAALRRTAKGELHAAELQRLAGWSPGGPGDRGGRLC